MRAARRPHNRMKPEKHARRPAWRKIALIVVAMLVLAITWRFTPLREYLSVERLRTWAHYARNSKFGPLMVVASYTPAAFLLFPRPVLTLATVLAFGAYLGFAYACA